MSKTRACEASSPVQLSSFCNKFSIRPNPQVKTFIMEDIARLSKEANLAYYEQVLGKSTIQRFLFFLDALASLRPMLESKWVSKWVGKLFGFGSIRAWGCVRLPL